MTDPAPSDLLESLRAALAGRYDVERPLGAGGMGTVFLGRDLTLDRPVAIKVIAPELAASKPFRQRFLQEARTVAKHSALLEQFLLRERQRGLELPWAAHERRALLHGHCHQKAIVGTMPTVAALTWAGYTVSEIDSGCCGMAGSFGFEREHYDISIALGNRRLAPAVKAAPATTEVVAPGISCRQQIQHLAGRRAKHPAEVLREALAR